MNKLIIITVLAMVLSLGLASAWELNPFAEKLEPIMVDTPAKTIPGDFLYDKVTEYPVLRISNTFLWITTDKVAEYKLESNTKQCLINCEAQGKAVLYKDGKLFDDLKFVDKAGREVSVDSKYLLKTTETYIEKIPQYKEVCEEFLNKNTSKMETLCRNVTDSYKDEERTRDVWKDYKGEELRAGNYEWKLEGKKPIRQEVDFIPLAQGKELDEWAWWDANWMRQKTVNITGSTAILTNFTTLINVTYDSDMQADFDDLRFVDGACGGAQTDQLSYEIDNQVNSNYATVWVKIPTLNVGVNQICMYYSNPAAALASDGKNTFDDYYVAVWHFEADGKDSKQLHNLTNNGANFTVGKIGMNANFSSGKYMYVADSADWTIGNKTIETWTKMASFGNGLISSSTGTGDRWSVYQEASYLKFAVQPGDNPRFTTSAAIEVANVYQYQTFTRLNNDLELKTNNSYSGKISTATVFDKGGQLEVGRAGYNAEYSLGGIDEMRVSSIFRSSDWLNRSYDNANFTTFVFGDEESGSQNLLLLSTSLMYPANQSNFTSGTITFSANATYEYGNLTNMTLYVWNYGGAEVYRVSNLTVKGIATTPAITNITNFSQTTALADGVYEWNVLSCAENGTSTCTFNGNRTFLINSTISFTFQSQLPADIDSTNIFGIGANITYNVSSVDNSNINYSSIVINYKNNKTTSDISSYINGTAITGYSQKAYSSNSTNQTFLFRLFDNQVYPATYNINETLMENTVHSFATLGINDLMKIEFLNVSNKTAYNQYEIMMNRTADTSLASMIYYCNSTYTTGSPATDGNCYAFFSLLSTVGYNHTHSQYSSHMLIPLAINTTDGTIGTVKVTPTSYFIINGAMNNWNVYYIANTARTSATASSANMGLSYTPQTYTIDSHLHQYNGADNLWYYISANDINSNQQFNSTVRQELLNLSGLPPTSPNVYSPSGYFADYIPINYTAAVSPNQYNINIYNITLLNSDESFNQTIRVNNSQNLSYLWNGNSSVGIFKVMVQATDNQSQTSFGISEPFTLYGTQKIFNATTYETASESYGFQLGFPGNWTSASTAITYAGLSPTTTQTGNTSITSRDIPVTTTITPINFYWTTTLSNATANAVIRTNVSTQTINPITYGYCNASNNIPFIKIQFVNETIAQEAVPGHINTAWKFWIGNGIINKSITYANTTEALNWQFCFAPSTYNLKVIPSVVYANSESASRNYNPGLLLINSTLTTKSLFLLPNSQGTYVSFQVINPASQVLSGATVEIFQGTTSLTSGITDGSGIATFFLNPISSYTIVVSHPSYVSATVILTPTQPSYTIQLGGIVNANVSTVGGVSVSTSPKDAVLINDTTYLFNMTVTSTSWVIDSFGFNLGNITSIFSQVNTTSGTYISGNMNTGQNDTISMYYYWVVNGTNYNATRYWNVVQGGGTEFSISNFATDLKTYLTSGMFGLSNFGLAIIVFLIIFCITGIMSYKFGLTSPAAIAALVFVLVLFFDVGLGLVPNPLGAVPYFPSILVGVILGGLLIKEMT